MISHDEISYISANHIKDIIKTMGNIKNIYYPDLKIREAILLENLIKNEIKTFLSFDKASKFTLLYRQ